MKNLKFLWATCLLVITIFSCENNNNDEADNNQDALITETEALQMMDELYNTSQGLTSRSRSRISLFSRIFSDQEDQMGRPAINTVFVSSDSKDQFNVTPPVNQAVIFQTMFQDKLLALNPGYSTNALGLDAATFTTVLATDVLNVSTVGTTTFFDGANVLTGRTLADDVITTELSLIFGGPDGTENPELTDDNVDANDKEFLTSFPYLASPW